MINYLEIGKKFAESVWDVRKSFHIEDIMLYGSLARNESNPTDIDLMILHNGNTGFERMQDLRHKDAHQNNLQRYLKFVEILKYEGYTQIPGLENIPELRVAMSSNILNVQFLDTQFFINHEYKTKKAISEDPNFFINIFRDGKLWDNSRKDFIIPASQKYVIK